MSHTLVLDWHKHFMAGREELEYDESLGPLSKSENEKIVQKD
jgi:hypothetical protein